MTANTSPIFARAPDLQIAGAILGPSAQGGGVPSQGVDANTVSFYQADATEGSYVESVILKPVGSPAATVVRIYVCSVTGAFTPGTSNTAATVALVRELTLQLITASATWAQNDYEIPLDLKLPAGWRLLIGFGTSTGAAGTGYYATTKAGKY